MRNEHTTHSDGALHWVDLAGRDGQLLAGSAQQAVAFLCNAAAGHVCQFQINTASGPINFALPSGQRTQIDGVTPRADKYCVCGSRPSDARLHRSGPKSLVHGPVARRRPWAQFPERHRKRSFRCGADGAADLKPSARRRRKLKAFEKTLQHSDESQHLPGPAILQLQFRRRLVCRLIADDRGRLACGRDQMVIDLGESSVSPESIRAMMETLAKKHPY